MHPQNGTNPEVVRAHVARITSSELFAGAERLCRFLSFTVESKLNGREADVKEYTLGREVFDRGADYDPRLDPIVRVEARRLRSRLTEYYSGPGCDEPLRIEYPKGSYVPHIHASNGGAVPAQPQVARSTRRIAGVVALGVLIVLAVIAFVLLRPAPTIATVPGTWIQPNDGTLDTVDAALAEDIDAQLANNPHERVVAWPAIAQQHGSLRSLSQLASALGAQQLLLVMVRNEGAIRRINVFLVDEPQNRKRLALTYYADASLAESVVRDQYAKRIARDLTN
jgi:TolB-like protein